MGEVLRILPCEARPRGICRGSPVAVTPDTGGGGTLSGRRITHARCLRSRGNLPRIVDGHVFELCLTHAREKRIHERVLALAIDVGLHRRDEILRILSDEAWHSGPPADPARAMTRRAGDDLAARSLLVGSHRLGEVLRVLTRKARPGGDDADALLPVAPGTHGGRTPSRRWIADERSRRPSGNLARIISCNVLELRVAHAHENRPHKLVVALAGPVSLHGRDEILRILPDEAWGSGCLGDPTLAMTCRTTDGLQML